MRSIDHETRVTCPESETTDLARVRRRRKRRKVKASIEKASSFLPTPLIVISREPTRKVKKGGRRRKSLRNGARKARSVVRHENRKVKMILVWTAKILHLEEVWMAFMVGNP
jgi:hypothetical protein